MQKVVWFDAGIVFNEVNEGGVEVCV